MSHLITKNNLKLLLLLIIVIFVYKVSKNIEDLKDNTEFKPETNKEFKLTIKNFKLYAVISANLDTNLYFYILYIPITCLSWRLIDYEPIVIAILSNNTSTNKRAQKVLEYLNLFNVTVVYLESVPNYEKMTGMLARLFVGLIDVKYLPNDALILQSDTDLIPINRDYYQNYDKSSDSIKILDVSSFQTPIGSFNYGKDSYKMYFMGHIGMRKYQWYELMNMQKYEFNGKSAIQLVKDYYGDSRIKQNNDIKRGDGTWFLDQLIVSINIGNYLKQDSKNHTLMSKLSPGIKLDRVWDDQKWLDTFENKYNSINDVHLFHENYIEKMPLMNKLFTKLFSKEQKTLIDKYINEFLNIK